MSRLWLRFFFFQNPICAAPIAGIDTPTTNARPADLVSECHFSVKVTVESDWTHPFRRQVLVWSVFDEASAPPHPLFGPRLTRTDRAPKSPTITGLPSKTAFSSFRGARAETIPRLPGGYAMHLEKIESDRRDPPGRL